MTITHHLQEKPHEASPQVTVWRNVPQLGRRRLQRPPPPIIHDPPSLDFPVCHREADLPILGEFS